MLDLTPAKTEEFLSRLVTSKTVYAKIDRPAGIVSFLASKGNDAVLNEWSSDVGKLMGLIEKSCHLIAKVSLFSLALWTVGKGADGGVGDAGARGAFGVEGDAESQGVRM